jgi:hypothetical protein
MIRAAAGKEIAAPALSAAPDICSHRHWQADNAYRFGPLIIIIWPRETGSPKGTQVHQRERGGGGRGGRVRKGERERDNKREEERER